MDNHFNTEKLLNSLNGLQRATPGDFFYTRVQARLEREERGNWGRFASFITRPVVAFSTLAIIFLLNTAAFFLEKKKKSCGKKNIGRNEKIKKNQSHQ